MSIDLATHNKCVAFIRKAFADQIENLLACVAAIWNELTPSPANHIPRADDLRIRKFTPKNLSYSHLYCNSC